MKILSWNVNGIRSVERKGVLQEWINKQDAEIINLQEIKAQPEQIPETVRFENKFNIKVNSGERKGYSGVLTYTKEEPKKFVPVIGIDRFDTEGRMIWLRYDKFSLINFYVPNGGRDKHDLEYKMKFYDCLIKFIKEHKNENLILAGDFNIAHKEIDLARPEDNKNSIMFTPKERAKMQELIDTGLVDTFRMFHKEGEHYSWWAYFNNLRERNIGWRIDYIFVTKPLRSRVKGAFIQKDVIGSDHCPVGIDLDI